MKIIFVRHGESEVNAMNIVQGHGESPLSQRGRLQAKKVAERLEHERIDYIYASDIGRAEETAEIIAEFHPNVPFLVSEIFRERALGVLDGRKIQEIMVNPELAHLYKHGGEEGVESRADVRIRAEKVLKELIMKHPEETILIVSHGSFGRAFLAAITNDSYEESLAWNALKNTSVSIMNVEPNSLQHMIELRNCVKHLEDSHIESLEDKNF